MADIYEKQSASTMKGELKHGIMAREDRRPQTILWAIVLLVAVQAGLFIWTFKLLSDVRETLEKSQKLIPALKQISKQINEVTAAYPEKAQPKIERAQVKIQPVAQESPKIAGAFGFDFDSPKSEPEIGKNLLLVKKTPNSSMETVAVRFDETARLGGKGKGMRIEYEFKPSGPADNWVGLDIAVPPGEWNPTSEISFWIKGDSTLSYNPSLKLFVSDGVKTTSVPAPALGAFWKRVHFSMNKIPSSVDYRKLQSVRLVIEDDGKSPKKGAYSFDRFEIR